MKKNKIFKEIECRIVDVSGRPYVSLDDLDKIQNDLCFTKSELDIPTLRTIKRLNQSIALTYKALKAGDELDVNDMMAIVPLSRKKVKKLVKKSLAIAKKEQDVNLSHLDPLEDYLAEEEPSLSISKEEAEELILGSVTEALEPYLELLKALLKKNTTESPKLQKKQKEAAKPKLIQAEKVETVENVAEAIDEEIADVDFEALENSK
ncbi:MAG: hypothetical protein HFG91_07650 [Acholeplasmatales bacterium]|nr:hypothetical protein [Acholeplasmatales bacterium]